MAGFIVGVSTAVDRFKYVSFLQPVYESITNSLEAGATNINVIFYTNKDQLPHTGDGQIIGFSIEDNGEGFIEKNLDAFKELYTKNKIKIGCKGVGRLTWLKVFKKVEIKSFVENKIININFHRDFDFIEDIKINDNIEKYENKTTITFSEVSNNFYDNAKRFHKPVDDGADLEKIYDLIEKHLLVKLLLLKKNGKSFEIKLNIKERSKKLTDKNVKELLEKSFEIEDIYSEKHTFTLYYNFFENKNNLRDLYYCANNRVVTKFHEEVNLSKLPTSDSLIMLLTSKYLDEHVNDERNDFNLKDDSDYAIPLVFNKINTFLRKKINDILLVKYPDIDKYNEKIIKDTIEKFPYLAEYIRKDESIIKDKEILIETAKKSFERDKIKIQSDFANMLEKKKIDSTKFKDTVNKISKVAMAELGEYILFRQNIIEALESAINDIDRKEDFIHNIFMQMKTSIEYEKYPEENRYCFNNFWLLDDKFMTYSYAASDKTINQIKNIIYKDYSDEENTHKSLKRPDLVIFFSNNKESNKKDAIIVEFKGANTSYDEKRKSITELPNNMADIKKCLTDVETIWGYIITTIDDKFAETIENTEKFEKLFSDNVDYKAFYGYYQKSNAHVTIIDLRMVISDSKARNNTFLNILKKS